MQGLGAPRAPEAVLTRGRLSSLEQALSTEFFVRNPPGYGSLWLRNIQVNQMIEKSSRLLAATAAASLLIFGSALAQTTPAPDATTTPPAANEAVEVEDGADDGFDLGWLGLIGLLGLAGLSGRRNRHVVETTRTTGTTGTTGIR